MASNLEQQAASPDPDRAAAAAGGQAEFYRFLMDNTHDVVSLHDVEGHSVYVSPSAQRLLGRVPTGQFDGIHPDDLPAVRQDWQRILAGEKTLITYRFAHADGSWRWLEVSGSLVDFRAAPHVLTVCRDVTEGRHVSDALRAREELLRLLTDNANEFIRLFDLDGRVVYVNAAVERLLGRVPPNFLSFMEPEEVEAGRQWWQRILEGSTDLLYWRVRDRYGDLHWMESQGAVVPYQGRQHFLTICRDVTQRHIAAGTLRASERKLAEAERLAHVGYWDNDLDTNRITWSEEVYRIFGLEPREGYVTWPEVLERIHPEDRPMQAEASARAQRGEARYDIELRLVRADGEVRIVHSVGDVIRDPSGRPYRLFGVVQDITERKRAEDEIRRQQEVFQKIFDSAPIGISFFTPDGRPALDNREWERIVGWTLKELAEQNRDPIEEALPDPRDREFARGVLAAATGEWVDLTIKARDGRTVDVSGCAVPLSDGARIGLMQDITQRKRAEAALRESADRLQHLSRRLLEVQEEERRHIARELHDEVGQLLTRLKFAVEAAASTLPGAADSPLAEASALIADTLARVRKLSLDLRPAHLDYLGLLPALRWLGEQFSTSTGVRVNFQHAGLDRRFPAPLELAAYRVVQEGLTNVARHARVEQVAVRVWVDADTLNVQVEDAGAGFDVQKVLSAAQSSGLPGMRERLALLGGQLRIESAPGEGTSLLAEFPLPHPQA